jgi:hypothetical protein
MRMTTFLNQVRNRKQAEKKLKRTSTEPVIPPTVTPDSTDVDSDDYEDSDDSESDRDSREPDNCPNLSRHLECTLNP